jgi:AbrB family looped-hinge helix DNA binding protein
LNIDKGRPQAYVDLTLSYPRRRRTPVEITRLSSKAQMVVPKAVRDALNLPAGAELMVELGEGCFVVRPKDGIRPTSIDDVIGMFKVDRPISDEEIERAIDEGYRARWLRKR